MKSTKRRSLFAASKGIAVRIRGIWEGAQAQASRSVNTAHVIANWLIGKEIVEEQQEGRERARYGDQLMKRLSEELQEALGQGFSISSLQYMRDFHLQFPSLLPIQHPAGVESGRQLTAKANQHPPGVDLSKGNLLKSSSEWKPGMLHTSLSWRHCRTLLRVDRPARDFYEIEAIKCNWNGRQLERLAKSRDKAGVLALANEGHVVSSPLDLLREPFVLEFLKLPESHQLTETDLEGRLLSQLREFLLELGEGFAFVGRQRRITLEGDHFFPDLVFYHIRLRCYVIIDLKLKKLEHADLGQMLLYVNFYDQEICVSGDQPTVGLILCTDKNETVARYMLGEKRARIFATRYQPHLPSVEQLEAELRRERERIEDGVSMPCVAAVKKALSARKKPARR